MAYLVGVCNGENHKFQRRQLPLNIDDIGTMVIRLGEKYFDREMNRDQSTMRNFDRFDKRYSLLNSSEVVAALKVDFRDIYDLLTQVNPCVGCRRSVERLYNHLVTSKNPALDPLVVKGDGLITINSKFLEDSTSICALFYIHGNRVNAVVDSIPRSKKNKRCNIHSLDGHRSRSCGTWLDTWEVMSGDCKDEILLIDADSLLQTLTTHLRKHRFCVDCKTKVLHAYNILIGDVDSTSDKTYCQSLYDGLRCCPKERHVHVPRSLEYIAELISRAEPELAGSHRELHAKTLDVAQEEVLTCLGLCIYDRLSRIGQKLRAEEQTWQLLFYISVDAIRNKFEAALEHKEGISKLELICEELIMEENVKKIRKEQKRQKKKLKKKEAKQRSQACDEGYNTSPQKCKCGDTSQGSHTRKHCSRISLPKAAICSESTPQVCTLREETEKGVQQNGRSSDPGYSSDSCDNCSNPSSNASDIVDSVTSLSEGSTHNRERTCCQDCDKTLCTHKSRNNNQCRQCQGHCEDKMLEIGIKGKLKNSQPLDSSQSTPRIPSSLQDLLEEACSVDQEAISDEDIRLFRENKQHVLDERQRLRKHLKISFENLQIRGNPITEYGTNAFGTYASTM